MGAGSVAKSAVNARAPRPPEELVGALHDRVHRETGTTRAAKSVRTRETEVNPRVCRWCVDGRWIVYGDFIYARFAVVLPLSSVVPAGYYDPNTNMVVTDEPWTLFEGKRAPGS